MSESAAAIRAFFARCVENVDKVSFTLVGGQDFLGWVADVTDDHVLVSWAPNPIHMQVSGGKEWNREDEWLAFTDIKMDTLASYDAATRRWGNRTH